jgi:ATP-dependent helicase HrpA
MPDRPPLEPRERVRRDRGRLRAGPPVHANPLPPIEFPADLPVSALRETIARAIQSHQVVIVCGETGSGKTTQLPKICLALGRGAGAGGTGLIGHTQPRRLAATSTARRIASELGTPLGEHVGFKIRFHDQLSRGASVKLMTDGILLAETQGDPLLRAYDTLIIDEAHERSLNIDFLLGYIKRILPERKDLKVIVTSATIDAERFARHFASGDQDAPVIEVSGRLYEVEVRYRPVENGERDRDLMDAIVDGVAEACACGPGDVLVFLPGEREIREAAEALRKHHPPHTEILPLYARLAASEQERVFRIGGARRIVLATNVAETSLTVPGIRYVVDTGLARVKRYSYRNKVEQLQVEPISQAAARQRAGRCGRVADGVCIRLYEESDFVGRAAFTEPEILRSSLAAVILRMQALKLGDVEAFPFLEAPSGRAVADGYQLLSELGAVTEERVLTPLGEELARLPLDPRAARMILAGREHDCLTEMLILASALSVQDPRERPLDLQEAADTAHRRFADEKSEFLSDLKLWNWFEEAVAHKKSNRQLGDTCREAFVSQLRMREWRDVHSQLLTTVTEHGWRLNGSPATFEQVHLALLAGLLGNVGLKSDEDAHYLGPRGIKFFLWPGSSLARRGGRWVMAAELVETSRLFARKLARIEPVWLERVGAHLLKRSHSEPHWSKNAQQVVAFERATLYGLVVYAQRRIDFARLDPKAARSLFIRDGLVAGMRGPQYEPRAAPVIRMLAHNRELIGEIEKLEHKTRRPDVLVDDELIVALCEAQIPGTVHDGASFEKWYTQACVAEPRLLYLSREALMRHEAVGVTTEQFPKSVTMGGVAMALDYHFEPGSARDGVTLCVPLYALNQVDGARAEWLVPGMLKQKVQLLIKSLPQKLRRHCVPLPDYAAEFCLRHAQGGSPGQGLLEALIADIRAERDQLVRPSDFKLETLPVHLSMNFRVVDAHGRQLSMGRSLDALRGDLGGAAQRQFQEAFRAARLAQGLGVPAGAGSVPSQTDGDEEPMLGAALADRSAKGQVTGAVKGAAKGAAKGTAPEGTAPEPAPHPVSPRVGDALVDWSFGVLPETMEFEEHGVVLVGYPALVDHGTECRLAVLDDPRQAERLHRGGIRRLFLLQLRETARYLEKNLPNLQQMALQFMAFGSLEDLRSQIVELAIERACMADPLPVDAAEFQRRCTEGKARLVLLGNEIARLAGQILAEYSAAHKKLATIRQHAQASADIEAQLARLLGKRFLVETPYEQLAHFPRYLKAVGLRIDKLRADSTRDQRAMSEFAPLLQRWLRADAKRRGAADRHLADFRWLLEELRVALFAQELRTPMPVSVKRLTRIWESAQG